MSEKGQYLATTTESAIALPSWQEIKEQAAILVKSSFLPKALNTPEKAIAVMMAGRELGVPPMAAIRGLYVVDGKVTADAQLMLALAHRSGKVEQFIVDDGPDQCKVTVKRQGMAAVSVTWTDADTERAGLSGFAWNKYPRIMRRWRAITEALRLSFPDVLAGIYTPDELGVGFRVEGDDIVVDAEVVETPLARTDPETGEIKQGQQGQGAQARTNRADLLRRITELLDKARNLTDSKRYNPHHLKNHLEKHYGPASVPDLDYDQLVAFGTALRAEVEELEAAIGDGKEG